MIEKTTFIITSFLRGKKLDNLLDSIKKYYPKVKVIIAEQTDDYLKCKDYLHTYHGADLYFLPFDSGLSFSRNFLVDKVKTEYCLLLEDDFVFTDNTNIDEMVRILESDSTIGVVGGKVTEFGQAINFEYLFNFINIKDYHLTSTKRILKLEKSKGDIDCVLNFALFRTELFNDNKWDEKIKINGEHLDFYIRLKELGKWKIKYCPLSVIDHDKGDSSEYKYFRRRQEFLIYMMTKNNLTEIQYPSGLSLKLNNGNIVRSRN